MAVAVGRKVLDARRRRRVRSGRGARPGRGRGPEQIAIYGGGVKSLSEAFVSRASPAGLPSNRSWSTLSPPLEISFVPDGTCVDPLAAQPVQSSCDRPRKRLCRVCRQRRREPVCEHLSQLGHVLERHCYEHVWVSSDGGRPQHWKVWCVCSRSADHRVERRLDQVIPQAAVGKRVRRSNGLAPAEGLQDVFLRPEVAQHRPGMNTNGGADLLDGDIREAAVGEQAKGEEPFRSRQPGPSFGGYPHPCWMPAKSLRPGDGVRCRYWALPDKPVTSQRSVASYTCARKPSPA